MFVRFSVFINQSVNSRALEMFSDCLYLERLSPSTKQLKKVTQKWSMKKKKEELVNKRRNTYLIADQFYDLAMMIDWQV